MYTSPWSVRLYQYHLFIAFIIDKLVFVMNIAEILYNKDRVVQNSVKIVYPLIIKSVEMHTILFYTLILIDSYI